MSEIWVDIPTVVIPPADQWGTMSADQLIEIKSKILDKMVLANGKPLYLNPLKTALARIDSLIYEKINSR